MQFDASKLSEERAQTIKMNVITEWSALPATVQDLTCYRKEITGRLGGKEAPAAV
jgi:hypothetical protein